MKALLIIVLMAVAAWGQSAKSLECRDSRFPCSQVDLNVTEPNQLIVQGEGVKMICSLSSDGATASQCVISEGSLDEVMTLMLKSFAQDRKENDDLRQIALDDYFKLYRRYQKHLCDQARALKDKPTMRIACVEAKRQPDGK